MATTGQKLKLLKPSFRIHEIKLAYYYLLFQNYGSSELPKFFYFTNLNIRVSYIQVNNWNIRVSNLNVQVTNLKIPVT